LKGNPLYAVLDCFECANAASPDSLLRNQDDSPGRIFDTDAPAGFFASGLSAYNAADDKADLFLTALFPSCSSWIADRIFGHNTSA
jgi:hypothetical protein